MDAWQHRQAGRAAGVSRPGASARVLRQLGPSALIGAVVPVLAYLTLRVPVGSDLAALAIGGAIPLALTIVTWTRRRRVDLIGALSVCAFAVALVVTGFAGSTTLPLELRRATASGLVGLACVISVVARRPLWRPTLRLLARARPQRARAVERIVGRAATEPAFERRLTVATMLIGLTLVGEAAGEAILALSVSTTTFLLIRLAIGSAGAAIVLGYFRLRRARR